MSLAAVLLAIIAVAAVALVGRLFWPAARSEPGPDGNWQQHNDQRMPSLETVPEAGHTEVDTAVAAQINGVD